MSLRNELNAFYRKHGYLVAATPQACDRALRKRLAPNRYAGFEAVAAAIVDGRGTIEDVYAVPASIAEANLIMSRQARATLAAAEFLCETAAPRLCPGTRAIELGCWTGTLLRWLAARQPQARFLGIDGAPNIVRLAQADNAAPNVEFLHWDYREPPADPIPPADLLLSSFGIDFAPNPYREARAAGRMRASRFYAEDKAEAARVFTQWRSLAVPGAFIALVLRIATPTHLVAVLDAAHDIGWRVRLDSSRRILAGSERFPALIFDAAETGRTDEATLDAWWDAAG